MIIETFTITDYLNLNFLIANSEELAHGGNRLEFLDQCIFIIETFLEIAALIIIILASLKALQRLVLRYLKHQQLIDYNEVVRLEFGLSLALSLEFLLAADIAATAVAPSWEALGKLAVVAAIRTFLNFFLEKEVEKLEDKNKRTKVLIRQIREFGKLPRE
ncbi:protein of unknown function DUF1622 [[Leptolyngbya] sp. PCC 7376]|uniref:DUF1622 domain-containing protein n=1 Tax=[Leptolyngbya] sp. PCC 7376 TaxID=111781 RepID=UPI00029F41B4|nr:DUF1622 domain-containing protein [[Leptolyngbya] sp. PCC 7376]AFY39511.1 protein of unknown function DUF1622 [[Leptolyngbya] sp. PCC 7376]